MTQDTTAACEAGANAPSGATENDVGSRRNGTQMHDRPAVSRIGTAGVSLPIWAEFVQARWGERLVVDEWEPEPGEAAGDGGESVPFRQKNGWLGTDLVHDPYAPVRVLEYYVMYGDGRVVADAAVAAETPTSNGTGGSTMLSRGGVGTVLTGTVHFTRHAESHRGYCHGGSMCSVMDDCIGWVGFCVTGSCRPWTGFTVQVNTSLQKPIRVGSVLVAQAKIVRVERRKVSVEARIIEPEDPASTNGLDEDGDGFMTGTVHATGEGLVIVNRGVLPGT